MTATTLTMASLSATGLLRFASPSLTSTTRFQPLSLSNRFRSPFRPFRSGQNLRFMSSASPSITITPISVGEKLPDATLSYLDSADEVRTVSISDLTKGKKTVLFAVPGAFTPTCSQKHLPGFVQRAGELRAKGVNTIACVSVNDAFVMKAWKEYLKIGDEVLLLSDGNGDFTRALGVELDLRDKPAKLGIRSRRYSLLAEDGVIKLLNMEAGGAYTVSGAEDILKAL